MKQSHHRLALGILTASLSAIFPKSSFAAPLLVSIQSGSSIDRQTTVYDEDMGPPMVDHVESTTLLGAPAGLNYSGVSDSTTFEFRAPAGYAFLITPQSGATFNFQVAFTTYIGGAAGGLSSTGTGALEFMDLSGTVPSINNYSTLNDLPHAYNSLSFSSEALTEPISFTGFRYTVSVSGVGNSITVPYFEGGRLNVYLNAAPSGTVPLLSLAATIPEPSSAVTLAGLCALTAVAFHRRKHDRPLK